VRCKSVAASTTVKVGSLAVCDTVRADGDLLTFLGKKSAAVGTPRSRMLCRAVSAALFRKRKAHFLCVKDVRSGGEES